MYYTLSDKVIRSLVIQLYNHCNKKIELPNGCRKIIKANRQDITSMIKQTVLSEIENAMDEMKTVHTHTNIRNVLPTDKTATVTATTTTTSSNIIDCRELELNDSHSISTSRTSSKSTSVNTSNSSILTPNDTFTQHMNQCMSICNARTANGYGTCESPSTDVTRNINDGINTNTIIQVPNKLSVSQADVVETRDKYSGDNCNQTTDNTTIELPSICNIKTESNCNANNNWDCNWNGFNALAGLNSIRYNMIQDKFHGTSQNVVNTNQVCNILNVTVYRHTTHFSLQ